MDNKKIESMKAGGKILGDVLSDLVQFVKPGVTELDIEKQAEALILEKGGKPGFQLVPGYDFATCISTNDVVVHGLPKKRVIKDGDIVGIDCGVYYHGYHTDMSETVRVQSSKLKVQSDEIDKFLETGKRALYEAIKQARVGNRVGHVSKTIQDIVEGAGYSIVRSLVGHGVGEELHMKPEIPGYLNGKIEKTPELYNGMTIAIEVIYNMGDRGIAYHEGDDWTIFTEDGSLSGLFERTVLVTDKEPVILTELSAKQ